MSRLGHAAAVFRGHAQPRFRIIERRRVWFAISGVLIAISIVGLFWPGLNLSIDFEGGALITASNPNGVSVDEVEQVLADAGRPDAEVQEIGADDVSIRTDSFGSEGGGQEVIASLADTLGIAEREITLEDVGPTWGAEISRKALTGMLVVLAAITIYITLRFEWKMAVAALAAVVHDILVTVGVY